MIGVGGTYKDIYVAIIVSIENEVLVIPPLEYYIQPCRPCRRNGTGILEKIQITATKLIAGPNNLVGTKTD